MQKWCPRDVCSLQSRGHTEQALICGCRRNSLQGLPSWFGCSANHGSWLRLYSTPTYPGTQESCDISNGGFYKETRPQIQWKHFKMLLELLFFFFFTLIRENHSMLSIGLIPIITYWVLLFAGPGENRYQWHKHISHWKCWRFCRDKFKNKIVKKKKNTEKNSTYTQKAKKTDVPLLSYIRFSNWNRKKRKKAHFPFHSHFEEIISLQLRLTFWIVPGCGYLLKCPAKIVCHGCHTQVTCLFLAHPTHLCLRYWQNVITKKVKITNG